MVHDETNETQVRQGGADMPREDEDAPPETEATRLAEEGDVEEVASEGEELSLEEQLAQQRQEAAERLDHLQRLQAEFSNYRRRVAQEKAQAASRGKEEVLQALLPVVGNLRLALQHADQDANAIRQGVQMIWQQCEDFLHSQGVEAIPTVGQPFDPEKHEALSITPATDELPDNTIAVEISAGYLLHGTLLRAAQVVVARAPEPTSSLGNEDAPPASDS
jgi:molecular chaperone GrpE